MKRLLSLPLSAPLLAEYPGGALAGSLAALGLDGLEVVWAGEPLPRNVPAALHIGYHLTFWADWLDFWRGDRAALGRKFGSEAAWRSFYGGPEGRDTLLALWRADLERAEAWGARYVVFHVSDVSIEEGYTYRWEHSHEEVIAAALETLSLLWAERDRPFALLVENQWWPGFTFTDPALTRRLLEGLPTEDRGIMLDIGHLMNTDPSLRSQAGGAALVHRMLDLHGELAQWVRGVHLHQSLSGAYVNAHTGALPPDLRSDYLARFSQGYGHILNIDRHQPWTDPAVAGFVARIAPEFLVHELSAPDRKARERAAALQIAALRRGGLPR